MFIQRIYRRDLCHTINQCDPRSAGVWCIGWKNKAGWSPLGRVGKRGTEPTESGDQPLRPHCAGDNPYTQSLLKETL